MFGDLRQVGANFELIQQISCRYFIPQFKVIILVLALSPCLVNFVNMNNVIESRLKFLVYPTFITTAFVDLTIGMILCKWILVGRFKAGAHDMGTWWFVRRLLSFALGEFGLKVDPCERLC